MSFLQMAVLFVLAAPFGLAVWVAFRHRRPREFGGLDVPDESMQVGATRACFKSEILYLEGEVKAAADALAEEAREQYVCVQIAVIPGSRVYLDWNALRQALLSAIRTAIRATPGGNVLVTGKQIGTEMHIVVIDDGAAADQRSREGLAREAEVLIALQGGSVAVEAKRGRGTTATIRLPVPHEADAESLDMMAEAAMAREAV